MPTPKRDRRPGAGRWLRYAVGGRLRGYDDWVRHDLTAAGWRWRGVVRVLVQLLPVIVVCAVLPGPGFLHVLLPLFVVLGSVGVTAAYGDDLRDRRLRQHNLPVPNRDYGPY